MHHSSPADFLEDFGGCLVSQGLPRGVIDFLLDFIDVLLGDTAHVRASREIPSDDPIHVLHPSLLPGGVWITEIGLDAIL